VCECAQLPNRPTAHLPNRQREDFLNVTVVVEDGVADHYSDNDLVLISKDDPYVSGIRSNRNRQSQ
jgi:hypothetical protein